MQHITISKDLFIQLKMDRQINLSIHSVYDDVINTVDSRNTLISFLNQGKRLVPMGVLLQDKAEFQRLKKYNRLTIGFTDSSMIRLKDGVDVFDLYLYSRPQNINKVISANATLLQFLQSNAPGDSFYPIIHPLIAEGATNFSNDLWDNNSKEVIIPRLKKYLHGLYHDDCMDDTLNIFGFGRGLTPSSDDFILGLSAVFQYVGDLRLNTVKSHGERFLDTTTFISSQMLKNAWYGQYNAFLHQLFQAIGQEQLCEEVLVDVTSYGHTSGTDTLCGIVMGIEILKGKVTF